MAAQCDAFIAVRQPSSKNAFPTVKLPQSVKMWQQSYFYVENVDPAVDFINLPAYEAGRQLSLGPTGATSRSRYQQTAPPPSTDSGC